ncbi:hypothetical protein AR685_04955 [Chryseobacterium sp. JAH]|nr:hypothetical protein AR685_04955 [Chryseobacterium sp. JAH]
MIRKIKFCILIIVISYTIVYFDYKIAEGDPNFHYGKDGGIILIIESILILGSLFFLVMAKTKRFLFFILGFFTSLIGSILIYLILGFCNIFENSPFHIISCISFIIIFFCFEKLINKNTIVEK